MILHGKHPVTKLIVHTEHLRCPQVSLPKLCPSDQDEYPLKVICKKSRRFSKYNHNNQHKQRPNKVKNNDHCVNLSSCTLTKEETSILSKGLGFVPTPPVPHPSTIQKDINKFAHTLRLKYEFQQNRPKKKKFKLRSNYIPHLSTSGCLEDYIYSGTSEIRTPRDLAKLCLFRRCP